MEESLNKKQESSSATSTSFRAQGGAGGRAINLTYIDNYSSLLLVYTFLLNLANNANTNNNQSLTTDLHSLLPTLKSAMEEEKKYREEFLSAVQLLRKPE